MEAPLTYEREEEMEMEMEMEMGLEKKTKKPISPTSSDGSCVSTDITTPNADADPHQLLEPEANTNDKNLSFDEINVCQNQAEESEPRVEEYDVEKVIHKQETHDLYCPNCSSCITKRVILRRRKRKIPEISKGEVASVSGLDPSCLPAVSDIPEAKSEQPPRGVGAPDSCFDAISCFSCFSIFIPSGEGFLCWRFKPKADATQLKDKTSISIVKAEDPKIDSSGTIFPLWIVTCCQPAERMKLDTKASPRQAEPSLPPSGDMPVSPTPLILLPEHSTSKSYLDTAPTDDVVDRPVTPFKSGSPAIFVPGTSSPSKSINPVVPINDTLLPLLTEPPAAPGCAALPMHNKPQPPVISSHTHGPESRVDVENGLPREPPRPGVSGLDVIKAMVYGGLLESITSLSVITSAAGGDATTLNIVALGLANVFGGLVVLVHNLRVLKHEHTTEHYEAQLGRPRHYMLHAIVAITSYLIFGLMSPIIYGFSFRKSDNKDYKLATLAGAALACITLLSAAKAYVRTDSKYIKTVFYYVSLGFMVSGLGYVMGDVMNMLLKKFDVFDHRATDNVLVLAAAAAGVMDGAWSSY